MKVKLLEPIDGFEDVAEYRVPVNGERYMNARNGNIEVAIKGGDLMRLVLTPIKRWRPATIDDAVRAIKGAMVVARFRDRDTHDWQEGELSGYAKNREYKWASHAAAWNYCEVLDA